MNGADLLQNRTAILRDVRREGETLLRRGLFGRVVGAKGGGAISVSDDSEEAREHLVSTDACADVDASGGMPADHSVAILYSAVVGSRAQELATDLSDTDRRGLYIASPQIQFGLDGSPAQLVHDGDQLCYWEAEKFLRLALNANPTVLETLYSPLVEVAGPVILEGLFRLKQRGVFLSRRVQETFMGYADSQFEKMARSRSRGGPVKWQHAMHLIRLLRVGTRLMRTGELSVVVPSDQRSELLAIRRGDHPWEDLCRLRERLVGEFAESAENSPLPDEPDTRAVNDFLVELRTKSVEEARR